MRKRILFYVRKGNGLGHLRRLTRIAARLSESYSCLFVSSHPEMSWFVPDTCEYYFMPELDKNFRSQFLLHMEQLYQPGLIFLDHSVNGNDEDVQAMLYQSKAIKIMVLRGVLDSPAKVKDIYLNSKSRKIINALIDHIVVACDERIIDITNYGFLDKNAVKRIKYVGYVAPPQKVREIKKTGIVRVVCSPGGGYRNYHLLNIGKELAGIYKDETFWKIVYGPKNNKAFDYYPYNSFVKDNCNFISFDKDTDQLHLNSDIMVSKGGYNNLIEGISGGSFIICKPTGAKNDEQYIHSTRLSKYYDKILIANTFNEVRDQFKNVMTNRLYTKNSNTDLNMDGVENIYSLVKNSI